MAYVVGKSPLEQESSTCLIYVASHDLVALVGDMTERALITRIRENSIFSLPNPHNKETEKSEN